LEKIELWSQIPLDSKNWLCEESMDFEEKSIQFLEPQFPYQKEELIKCPGTVV
jgi:hypothetical protein